MKKYFNNHLFAFVFFANTLFMCVCAWLLPIHFQTNDDPSFCLLINGEYTGNNEIKLLYINSLYGIVLRWLYSFVSGLEWYTIIYLFIYVCSVSIIIWHLLSSKNISKPLKYCSCGFVYLLWIYFLANLEFTSVAAVTVVAGCVCLQKENMVSRCFGVLLIVLGALIRFNAATLMCILYLPLFWYQLKGNNKLLILLGSTMCVVLLCFVVNKLFYQTEEWKYNAQCHCRVLDDPDAGRIFKYYPEREHVDLCLLIGFMRDPYIMTPEWQQEIEHKFYSNDYWSSKSILVHLWQIKKYVLILLFVALLFILTTYNNINFHLWPSYLTCLLFGIIVIGISLYAKLKPWVFYPMLLPLIVNFDYMWNQTQFDYKARIHTIVLSSAVLCAISIVQLYQISLSNHSGKEQWENEIVPLLKSSPTEYVFIQYMPMWNINPWNVQLEGKKMIDSGWMAHTPYNKGKLDKFSDFITKDIAIIAHKDYPFRDEIKYIEKHYQIDVKVDVISEEHEYRLVKFILDNNE